MHPQIASRIQALEKRREAFVTRVAKLPAAKQKQKPASGGFSPADVVMHFAITEHGNLVFLKKTPPSTLKGRQPRTTSIFKSVVSKMQNPVAPLPTLPYMVPKGDVDLDQAAGAWQEARSQMKEYLEQVENPEDPFIKFNFLFGLGSASDYLDLLEAHMTYHEQRFPV